MKIKERADTKTHIDPLLASFAAGLSQALSSISLQPLENVKVRFQASDSARNNPIPQYKGITDAISSIYRTEGFAALYRSSLLTIARGSVMNSIFFYVYNDCKRRYGFDPEDKVKTGLISFRASLAGMIFTMPILVVKTRMALSRNSSE